MDGQSPSDSWSNSSTAGQPVPSTLNVEDWYVDVFSFFSPPSSFFFPSRSLVIHLLYCSLFSLFPFIPSFYSTALLCFRGQGLYSQLEARWDDNHEM